MSDAKSFTDSDPGWAANRIERMTTDLASSAETIARLRAEVAEVRADFATSQGIVEFSAKLLGEKNAELAKTKAALETAELDLALETCTVENAHLGAALERTEADLSSTRAALERAREALRQARPIVHDAVNESDEGEVHDGAWIVRMMIDDALSDADPPADGGREEGA